MKAWQVHEFGDYNEVLAFESVSDPEPSPGEAVVNIEAAGVMFADILNIAGGYQVKASLPFVPGAEAAGTIAAVGDGAEFSVGDRVAVVSLAGAFADKMIAPAQTIYPIPEPMPFAEAAAFTVNYQTAYFALAYRAQLKPNEWLLVHGGAGGVGTAAIQLGKALGARVIATAGSGEKCAVCRDCGADLAINYSTGGFHQAVLEHTEGRGADVIFDPIGGDVFDESTKCIAFEGRLVVIGFAGGRIPEIRANRILLKNFAVVGLFWGNYQFHNPDLIRRTQQLLYDLYNQGKIKPVIGHVLPLHDLPAALQLLAERKAIGKVVLRPQSNSVPKH